MVTRRLWQRLLFELHIRNSYPSYMTGLDGSKVPCNVIRTSNESFDIRPHLESIGTSVDRVLQTTPDKGDGTIHLDEYSGPFPTSTPEK